MKNGLKVKTRCHALVDSCRLCLSTLVDFRGDDDICNLKIDGPNRSIGLDPHAKKLIHRTTQGRWGLSILDLALVAEDLIHQ